jgi:hypothetical protein
LKIKAMGSKGTEQNGLGLIDVPRDRLRRSTNGRIVDPPDKDVYVIRPRDDGDGFDLISDRLRHGPIWYAGPDAVRNAIAYAKFRSHSRSRRAIVRVLDRSDAVIETH